MCIADLDANETPEMTHTRMVQIKSRGEVDSRRGIGAKTGGPLTSMSPYITGALEGDYFIALMRDVTDRKSIDKRFELLAHSVAVLCDGVYWMDADNRFIEANDAGCRALGYSRESCWNDGF